MIFYNQDWIKDFKHFLWIAINYLNPISINFNVTSTGQYIYIIQVLLSPDLCDL